MPLASIQQRWPLISVGTAHNDKGEQAGHSQRAPDSVIRLSGNGRHSSTCSGTFHTLGFNPMFSKRHKFVLENTCCRFYLLGFCFDWRTI